MIRMRVTVSDAPGTTASTGGRTCWCHYAPECARGQVENFYSLPAPGNFPYRVLAALLIREAAMKPFSVSRSMARSVAVACVAMLSTCPALADSGDSSVVLPKLAADVTKVPHEELLEDEVTPVSRHAEPVGAAATAIYLLTGSES